MNLIPKKFLCRYPLKLGATITGVFMCLVTVGSCIAAVIQVLNIKSCDECSDYAIMNAHALSIMACIYCFIMLFVNLWFLWGVRRGKSSVVISWVVLMVIWLTQSVAMLVVILCLYTSEVALVVWLLCLILSVIGIAIFIYGTLVSYGYWKELKQLNAGAACN